MEGLPEPRFHGANASGLARAVVGATGRLIEVELDPELLRRPAALVAEAVLSAVTDAQDRIPAQAQTAAPVSEVDTAALRAAVDDANHEAERRLAQFATLVTDLARSSGGRR